MDGDLMPIKINGQTTGSVTLTASATGSDVTLTLPNTTGTVQTVPGSWTNYTPVVTAGSGTITSYTSSGRYLQIGKTVWFVAIGKLTNAGTAGGDIKLSLPSNPVIDSAGNGFERGITGYALSVWIRTDGTVQVKKYDYTALIGTNYEYVAVGTYEVA